MNFFKIFIMKLKFVFEQCQTLSTSTHPLLVLLQIRDVLLAFLPLVAFGSVLYFVPWET